jgi:hypothetical protein
MSLEIILAEYIEMIEERKVISQPDCDVEIWPIHAPS